jgi:hypothetical protein
MPGRQRGEQNGSGAMGPGLGDRPVTPASCSGPVAGKTPPPQGWVDPRAHRGPRQMPGGSDGVQAHAQRDHGRIAVSPTASRFLGPERLGPEAVALMAANCHVRQETPPVMLRPGCLGPTRASGSDSRLRLRACRAAGLRARSH